MQPQLPYEKSVCLLCSNKRTSVTVGLLMVLILHSAYDRFLPGLMIEIVRSIVAELDRKASKIVTRSEITWQMISPCLLRTHACKVSVINLNASYCSPSVGKQPLSNLFTTFCITSGVDISENKHA